MYKLHFILKQHTPLIHFQPEQEGATLRATEVKPKLDRFIIEKIGNQIKTEWFNDAEHGSLNYKLRIEKTGKRKFTDLINVKIAHKKIPGTDRTKESLHSDELDGYFGNMMKIEEFKSFSKIPKKVSYYHELKCSIIFFDLTFKNEVERIHEEFFMVTNFGTRQSKGFGSFTVHNGAINNRLFYKHFTVTANNPIELFSKLNYFYKSIRSGINLKDRDNNDTFYLKSLLFLFYRHSATPVQWEKKTIKEKWVNIQLITKQISDRGLSIEMDQSAYSSNNKKIIKDLLGLSMEEQWLSYKINLKKKNVNENNSERNKNELIERFKSPITFKIVQLNPTSFQIGLLLDTSVSIADEWFSFESKGNQAFALQVDNNFSLHSYIDWLCNQNSFNIEDLMPLGKSYRAKHGIHVYETLKSIFRQLQNR